MPQTLTEEQFRETIRGKYPEHFKHVYAIHQHAEAAIGAYHNYIANPYHFSLSLIFGRAYKSHDSIRRLCEVASCEDAGVLLRNLLNLMAITRWISKDHEKRAKRYLDWYWVSLKADADKFSDRIPPSWLPTIEKHFGDVKAQFEFTDKRGQPQFARHWYEPEARSIRDLFCQAELEQHYDEAYSPLSSIEHSDINAFFAMTAGVDRSGDERQLEIQSDLFVPHYLRNAFQYFADIFSISNKTIPLTEAAKLDAITEAGKDFYAEDMKTRGMAPY